MSKQLVVAAVLVHDDQLLATRRSYPPGLAGKWEFPGGKVEPGESPTGALARELGEELGIVAELGEEIPPDAGSAWPINDALELRLWWARIADGRVAARGGHDRIAWLNLDQLTQLDWLPADLPMVEKLQRIDRPPR